MFAGTSAGGRLFGAPPAQMPSAAMRASLLIHLGAVALCFAGLGLWLASLMRRWATAFTTGALVILLTYLLDFLAIGWEPVRNLGWMSPFHYYPALGILAGEDGSVHDLLVLLAVTLAFTAAAYIQFQRRDL
jgi:ABC-type transport system involved in multi-copper enzyme maturation permease subunit